MIATAKIFKTGNSQAVRLPKAFRVEGDEVWISKNEATGEILLAPKPSTSSLDAFFALLEVNPLPRNFLAERHNPAEEPRNPLQGWKK